MAAKKASTKVAVKKAPARELFPGEKLKAGGPKEKLKLTDDQLDDRYRSGELRIVVENARYPLTTVPSMLSQKHSDGTNRYKLDPEYQRRHRWDRARQSRLIESFLLNVPIPPVFLYEYDDSRFEVMDGRQRLTALQEFFANKFELEGLEYWSDLNGRRYEQLPPKVRDGIDRRYISSVILLRESGSSEEQAQGLKKLVFERLNSGGVALSHQEARNAVYDGPLNTLCMELAKNLTFRTMWSLPKLDALGNPATKRVEFVGKKKSTGSSEDDETSQAGWSMYEAMEDVELVLRFFAYPQLASASGGLNQISKYLDAFLSKGNKFPESVLQQYRTLFEETVRVVHTLLGNSAFSNNSLRPTKVLYDPVMLAASHYVHLTQPELARHATSLGRAIQKVYEDGDRLYSGRSTNNNDVAKRDQQVLKAFREILGG